MQPQYLVMKLSVRPVIKARPTQTLPKLSPAVLLCPDLIVRKVAVRFFGNEHAKSTGVLLIVSEEQGGLYACIGNSKESEKCLIDVPRFTVVGELYLAILWRSVQDTADVFG